MASVVSGGSIVGLSEAKGAFMVEDCDDCVVEDDNVVANVPVDEETAEVFESDVVVLSSC